MKVLLVTTEFEPLTGRSAQGVEAAELSRELHDCPDTDTVVVMPPVVPPPEAPAFALKDTGIKLLLDSTSTATEPGVSARVLELRDDHAPQLFILEAEGLEQLTNRATAPAEALLLWAELVVHLVQRIRPQIHIVHSFGWMSVLVPAVIRSRRLPLKTVLSAAPETGSLPTIAAIREAASRIPLEKADLLVRDLSMADSLPSLAQACADRVIPISETHDSGSRGDSLSASTPTQAEALLMKKEEARGSVIEGDALPGNASGPLVFIPTADPPALLPILDRLLSLELLVVLQSAAQQRIDAESKARLLSFLMRYPSKFAWLQSDRGVEEAAQWLVAADVTLLLPADAEIATSVALAEDTLHQGSALVSPLRGNSPLIPETGSPFDAASRGPVFSYQGDWPESVWDAAKRALRECADPGFRKRLCAEAAQAHPAAEEGLPRFYDIYREVVRSTLETNP